LSPARRRAAVEQVREALSPEVVSERRACRVLGQPRSTQRCQPVVPDEEKLLVGRMVELATQYGRYGYRRITALLRAEGWLVNHKRVERLWRQEGLKVPQKQPKRRRLWLNDGSCVRLRPAYTDHVWSYDFMISQTQPNLIRKAAFILSSPWYSAHADAHTRLLLPWRIAQFGCLDRKEAEGDCRQ